MQSPVAARQNRRRNVRGLKPPMKVGEYGTTLQTRHTVMLVVE